MSFKKGDVLRWDQQAKMILASRGVEWASRWEPEPFIVKAVRGEKINVRSISTGRVFFRGANWIIPSSFVLDPFLTAVHHAAGEKE